MSRRGQGGGRSSGSPAVVTSSPAGRADRDLEGLAFEVGKRVIRMLRHLLLMKTSPYGCDVLVAADIWLARDANILASGGYASIPTSSQNRNGRAQAAPQINHEDIPATQMRLVSAGGQPLDRDVAPTGWEPTLAKLDAPLALILRKTFSSATCLTTQTRKLLGRQQRPRARQLRRRHCRTPPPRG